MRCLTPGVLLAGLLALVPVHAEANEGWRESHLTLAEALKEGYQVVGGAGSFDFYGAGGSLRVMGTLTLQLNHVLLMCWANLKSNCQQLNTQ
ncbi:MAG: hypothetical protein GDA49_01165 [Rhodospirillales bacterium]|nr:hypothetical protein [Rhodospirillales bacterium]